jgi:oligopeptide transport system ATP-binding protein
MTVDNTVLIRVDNLIKYFPIRQGVIIKRQVGAIKAVDQITFEVRKGETLGLVGESGSGKTTVGRTLLRIYQPTGGQVFYREQNITELKGEKLRNYRRNVQIIFQDPYSSLNPRMTIGSIIAEPLAVHSVGSKEMRRERVQELMELVGLNSTYYNHYPHEFSGGQRQRVGIARALALQPEFIVCDEPISALDVSIQAQVANLLEGLQLKFGLTYLFIAHDLSMVRHISDRVAVMYLGKIVELAGRTALFHEPLHPYSQALLSAVPIPYPAKERKRKQKILVGDIPSPANPPSGCRFHTRCPIAQELCSVNDPEWREANPNHWVACHFA